MLGEAVLGSSNSSEKIDLTRFWNWQDSPADRADAIPTTAFQASPLTSAVASAVNAAGTVDTGTVGTGTPAVGGSLASPSLITIAGNPTPLGERVLANLIAQSPNLAAATNVTGLSELRQQLTADTQSASDGRKQAIESVTNLQIKALESGAKIVESVAEAVAAVYGGGKKPGGDDKGDKPKGDKPKDEKPSTGSTPGGSTPPIVEV